MKLWNLDFRIYDTLGGVGIEWMYFVCEKNMNEGWLAAE
jgi:hypothetical protein